MADEILEQQEQQDVNYVEIIAEMKKNTVPKDDFNKLKKEHTQLLDSFINGGQMEAPEKKPKLTVQEMRNKLFKEDLNALEYCTIALELRQTLMDQGEQDPFLPTGKQVPLTTQDYEGAEKVARVLQECIETADGDAHIFSRELDRNIIDVPVPKKPANRR